MTIRQNIPVLTHSATANILFFWVVAFIVVGVKIWQTVSPSTDFMPLLPNLTAGYLFIPALALMLVLSPVIRISRSLGIFCLVGMMSLLINGVDVASPAYERLGYFVLMLSLLSPLVSSEALEETRRRMWRLLIWGLRAIVTVSFVMYIPWEINREPWQNCFAGCTPAGMSIGILAAIVLLDASWHLLRNRDLGRVKWIANGLLLAMSAILVVASGSRCALLSTVIGLLPLLWSVRRQRLKLLWALVAVAALSIVFVASSFKSFDGMKAKNEIARQHGSLTYSRDYLWEARLQEFLSQPIEGIGFDITTDFGPADGITAEQALYLGSTFEPGSSWLQVLSSTGLIGFLLICYFNVKLIRHLIRAKDADDRRWLYLSLLIALWVHGCFEGWLLYAGSTVFMVYWLLSSRILMLKEESAVSID